jgi:hypothetical protein
VSSGKFSSKDDNFREPEEQVDLSNLDASVLERVLEETVSATSDEPLSQRELDVLRAVAEKHGSCPLELEPVGVELVGAMVGLRFPMIKSEELREEMSGQIAESMFDVPEVRERLELLWSKLCESRA